MDETSLRKTKRPALIPRYPRAVNASVLHLRLAAQGFRVGLSTFQRYLNSVLSTTKLNVLPPCFGAAQDVESHCRSAGRAGGD